MVRLSLWLVFLMLISASVRADSAALVANILTLPSGSSLDGVLQYREDPQALLTPDNVLQQDGWRRNGQGMSFGYTRSVFWFRLQLENPGQEPVERLLKLAYPVLDRVQIYSRLNGGKWQLLELGDKQPFAQRPIHHRLFVIPLTLPAQQHTEWLFRVQTSSAMQFPLSIWEERDFFTDDQLQILGMGLYYGVMAIMVLYNLFVFVSVREANYLYYVLYVASMAAFMASLQGLSFQYLWPEATQWNDHSILIFLGGVVLFALVFARNFLQLKEMRRLNRLFNVLIFFSSSIILFSGVFPYHLMIRLLIATAVVGISLAIFSGVLRWGQGYSSARYYTIAWSLVFGGGVILAMNKFDILPRTFFTENIIQFGSLLEIILLSFALADRLNYEKHKRYTAQIIALELEKRARRSQEDALEHERQARLSQEAAFQHEREAREAQSRALDIQKQANETLEQRVRERTLELEEANRQLAQLSITDGLTGLRNRRYFDDSMLREMQRAQRMQEPLSVVMIDVDHFKKINDQYGHQAGDDILREVARSLRETVQRGSDLLARYGGEEFSLILPGCDAAGAVLLAEHIRQAVGRLTFDDGVAKGLQVTVSIGLHGGVPAMSNHQDEWIRYADEALYLAKANGRNQVVRYQAF